MDVHDFLQRFHREVYTMATSFDLKRRLEKEEKFLKWMLYHILAPRLDLSKVVKYQEVFHTKVDQLAADYKTWKDAGCKQYARPKQVVCGEVAKIAKRSFDTVLGTWLMEKRAAEKIRHPLEDTISDLDAA
ncbi:MAG: hypothetical protein A3F09_00385 [Chlamydiae bacterium RIFCSPHIGHO2_12_FULL_49_11]|nr:MAG: hypothetical protein A3F09_00385 [Chlamydiae bacterium RIFCSPHIGHO2_12_FULL_49_11]